MDFKQFNLLENKILQALENIKTLKAENAQLRAQISQLQQNGSNEKPEILTSQNDSPAALTDRELYISKKISEMLKKIEALETQI